VQGHEHEALLSASLVARDLSWVSGRVPHTHWVYAAKTRYRQPDAACEVERIDDAECEVIFAAAAMGGDARPVAGALRIEGLPGRRHDRNISGLACINSLAGRAGPDLEYFSRGIPANFRRNIEHEQSRTD
jgi:hypothetical protein